MMLPAGAPVTVDCMLMRAPEGIASVVPAGGSHVVARPLTVQESALLTWLTRSVSVGTSSGLPADTGCHVLGNSAREVERILPGAGRCGRMRGVIELRRYTAVPGREADVIARFRDHT